MFSANSGHLQVITILLFEQDCNNLKMAAIG